MRFSLLGITITLLCLGPVKARAQTPSDAAAVQEARESAGLRAELRGVLRDANGKAVPEAGVDLWLRPRFDAQSLGVEDSLHVKTDERGRFRASVLQGYGYSIGAHWSRGEATCYSVLLEGVRAGDILRLRESKSHALHTLRLSVRGALDLADKALRVRVSVGKENPRVLLEGDIDPSTPIAIQAPYATPDLSFDYVVSSASRVLARGKTKSGRISLRWKGRHETPLRVVDATGKPVVGAVVEARAGWETRWRDLGRSDADGRVMFLVPDKHKDRWVLRASAPGFGFGFACRFGDKYISRGEVAEKVPSEFVLPLVENAPLRGRILDFAGKPLAGLAISMSADLRVSTGKSSYRSIGKSDALAWTRADGSFQFRGISGAMGDVQMHAFLPPDVLAAVAEQLDGAPFPSPSIRLVRGFPVDCGSQVKRDLSKWKIHRCTVVTDAGPVRGAAVLATKALSASALDSAPRSDRRGQLTWLSQSAAREWYTEWLVVAEGKGYALLDRNDLKTGGPVEVALIPFAKQRVRIVDTKGKPVAGAEVSISGSARRGSTTTLIRVASKLDPLGLRGVSDKDGLLSLWYIQATGISYQLDVEHASGFAGDLAIPAQGTELWEIMIDSE